MAIPAGVVGPPAGGAGGPAPPPTSAPAQGVGGVQASAPQGAGGGGQLMAQAQGLVQAMLAEPDPNAIIQAMQVLGDGLNQVTQQKFGASLDQIAQGGGGPPGAGTAGQPTAGAGAPPSGPPVGAVGAPA